MLIMPSENYSHNFHPQFCDLLPLPHPVHEFSDSSISSVSSSIGIALTEDETLQVADELYYKVKELVHIAKLILTRDRRQELDIDDVRRAIETVSGIKIYGYDHIHVPDFAFLPEAGVYIEEDPDVIIPDSALNDSIHVQKTKPIVHGQWVMPTDFCEDEDAHQPPTQYYLITAGALMSGVPELMKVALYDLSTNPKITPESSYFLNLVALVVKKHPVRDYNFNYNLISIVEAILRNKHICATPYLATNRAVNALLKIVIEAPRYNNDHDILLRLRCSTLLGLAVSKWRIEGKQFTSIAKHLLEYLMDSTAPTLSHFGAIITLAAIGEETRISFVWPVFEIYVKVLGARVILPRYFDPYTLHVMAAIIGATRVTLDKKRYHVFLISGVYRKLYIMFGDSTIPQRQRRKVPKYLADILPLYPKNDCKTQSKPLMKLKMHKAYPNNLRMIHNQWNCLCDIFEDTDLHYSGCILADISQDNYIPKQNINDSCPFVYVRKSLKYTGRTRKFSSAGDLNLML